MEKTSKQFEVTSEIATEFMETLDVAGTCNKNEDGKFVVVLTAFNGTIEIRKSGRVAYNLQHEKFLHVEDGVIGVDRFGSKKALLLIATKLSNSCKALIEKVGKKPIEEIEFTELEKETIRQGLDMGFAYDMPNNKLPKPFLCWGFDGKRERGAVSSLVKKGVLEVTPDEKEIVVYSNYTIEELEQVVATLQKKEEAINKEEAPKEEKKTPAEGKKHGKNELGHIYGSAADLLDNLFLKGVTEEELQQHGITPARYKSHFRHLNTAKVQLVGVRFEDGKFTATLVK